MKLQKGKIYTTDKSDIVVKVLNIVYENDTMYKAKCLTAHKKLGMIYEVKYYRLYKQRIQHWSEYER